MTLDRDGITEDDAWAVLFVHLRDGSASELVVLDAARFEAPPVATVRLRERVPFGLHGDWIAAPAQPTRA